MPLLGLCPDFQPVKEGEPGLGIVMPRYSPLLRLVQTRGYTTSRKTVRMASDIAAGLAHLHANGLFFGAADSQPERGGLDRNSAS